MVRKPPSPMIPAIVVGGQPYGEADRIVRFLSPSHGRISAIAFRVRSARSPYGGTLEVGNSVSAALRRRQGSLWALGEVKLEDGHLSVRTDLQRLTLAAYSCELCAALAREDHAEPRLYGLLEMALLVLDALTGPPAGAFRLGLEAKALTFAGLCPSLDRCWVCGLEPAGGGRLDVLGGGFCHAHCGTTGIPVSEDWLRAAERARRSPLRDLVDVELPEGPAGALSDAVQNHLNRALRSRALLDQVLPLGAPPPPSSDAGAP